MSLWAYVPQRVFVGLVAELPATAQRLDTGEWVTDVRKWAHACGYWDTESPTVIADIQAAKSLTNAEVVALITAFNELRDRAAGRRGYVLGSYFDWQGVVGQFNDWLDTPPPPANQPVTRDEFLYAHERKLTEVLIPLGNFMFTLAQALLEQIERSETFVPPIGFLVD